MQIETCRRCEFSKSACLANAVGVLNLFIILYTCSFIATLASEFSLATRKIADLNARVLCMHKVVCCAKWVTLLSHFLLLISVLDIARSLPYIIFVYMFQNRKQQQDHAKQRSDATSKALEMKKEIENQRNKIAELIREKENLETTQQTQSGT